MKYVASSISQMTDYNKYYVYTGHEEGMITGCWYFWSGTEWLIGGDYQCGIDDIIEMDSSFTSENLPANAKAVGDMIVVSNTEPTSPNTELWIDPDTESVLVPTMDDIEGTYAKKSEVESTYARKAAVGSPLRAATASAMTDVTKIYVYTGSESGYTSGHWYYYNGSSWADGGVYNSTAFVTDKTLTGDGEAADAKVTGNELTNLKSAYNDFLTEDIVLQFEQGAFKADDASTVSTNNAIRSIIFVPDTVVKLSCSDNYKFNIWAWNKTSGNYVGHLQSDGTFGTGNTYMFKTSYTFDWAKGYKYKITFYNSDNSTAIVPATGSNLIAFMVTDIKLNNYGKIADAGIVGDLFGEIKSDMYVPIENLSWGQGSFGRDVGDRVITQTANAIYSLGFVSKKVYKISCSSSYKFNLWAWDEDSGDYVGHLESDGTFGTGATYLFQTEAILDWTAGYKYKVTFYNANNATAILPSAGVNCITEIKSSNFGTENITVSSNPVFSGSPVTIFENDGADKITGVDDGLLNTVSVIKISDNLYYMYYEACAANETAGYSDMRLCFAYSTDGTSFTKGFPSGITPPISDTNMLLVKGSTHGHCVVKVPDTTNPFRMITIDGNDSDRVAKIWKSADGINWTYIKKITAGYNDTMASCVVRGNMLKIFLRTRDDNGRAIGIITTDLDGNRTFSSWDSVISLNNYNRQLYTPSASLLDDKREILLPTVYDPGTSEETIGCVIVNGDKCTYVDIDSSSVVTEGVKSIYFASGLVNIGLKTYAFYETRDSDHEHFVMGTTKSAIRRIEVTDTTIPNIVRP